MQTLTCVSDVWGLKSDTVRCRNNYSAIYIKDFP